MRQWHCSHISASSFKYAIMQVFNPLNTAVQVPLASKRQDILFGSPLQCTWCLGYGCHTELLKWPETASVGFAVPCVCVFLWRRNMKSRLQGVNFTCHALGSCQCSVASSRSTWRVLSLSESFRLECYFVTNVLLSSSSASFRIPHKCVHLWPFAAFLTLRLATFSFLL